MTCPCCGQALPAQDFFASDLYVYRNGKSVRFTRTEFAIVEVLVKRREGISVEALRAKIYGIYDVKENCITVMVCNIRRKLAGVGLTVKCYGWGGPHQTGACGTYRIIAIDNEALKAPRVVRAA